MTCPETLSEAELLSRELRKAYEEIPLRDANDPIGKICRILKKAYITRPCRLFIATVFKDERRSMLGSEEACQIRLGLTVTSRVVWNTIYYYGNPFEREAGNNIERALFQKAERDHLGLVWALEEMGDGDLLDLSRANRHYQLWKRRIEQTSNL